MKSAFGFPRLRASVGSRYGKFRSEILRPRSGLKLVPVPTAAIVLGLASPSTAQAISYRASDAS
jgi:hypothetical protein